MIIYSSKLILSSDFASAMEPVFSWLSYHARKRGKDLRLQESDLTSMSGKPHEWELLRGAKIVFDSEIDNHHSIVHIEYNHEDSEVRGRTWTTEIGLESRSKEETELTVLLSTQDHSENALASTPSYSRPLLIKQVIDSCKLSTRTIGSTLKSITENEASEYAYIVSDPGRYYPIVAVSPGMDGRYKVDVEWLRSFVIGIADIVQIDKQANTRKLVESLGEIGRHIAVWNGAVAIIYPALQRRKGESRPYIPVERFLANEIDELAASGRPEDKSPIERAVLGRIITQVGRRFVDQHISVRRLHDLRLRNLLGRIRAQKSREGDFEAAEELLSEQQEEMDALRSNLDDVRAENAELRDQLFGFEFRKREIGAPVMSREQRDAIAGLVSGGCSPEQALVGIQLIYPERIKVLPSAYESAKDSQSFRKKSKLKELLWLLATEYWDKRRSKVPEPHSVFPRAAFAPFDTFKGGKQPKRARALRTFSHGGTEVHMPMHLKIGRGRGPGEGIRVHFEWDAESNRVLIGYCGRHLDTR